jgi:hypothetical protein
MAVMNRRHHRVIRVDRGSGPGKAYICVSSTALMLMLLNHGPE